MNATKITGFLKRRVLSNFRYLLVFWFADKMGMTYGLDPGKDLLQRLTRSMKTIHADGESLSSSVLFDLMGGYMGAGIRHLPDIFYFRFSPFTMLFYKDKHAHILELRMTKKEVEKWTGLHI